MGDKPAKVLARRHSAVTRITHWLNVLAISFLLLSGLQKQLQIACKSAGLRKINLKPGRWYSGVDSRDRKIEFATESQRAQRTDD